MLFRSVKRVVGATKDWVTVASAVSIPALTITSTSWAAPRRAGLAELDGSLTITVVGEAGRSAEASVSREQAPALGPLTSATVSLTETPAASGIYIGTYPVSGNSRIVSVTGKISDNDDHSISKQSTQAAVDVEAVLDVHLTGGPVAKSTVLEQIGRAHV